MSPSTFAVDPLRTTVATVFTMMAFAANSVLCRLALGADAIDAASFTTVRLLCGAFTLLIIVSLSRGRSWRAARVSWPAAGMLFGYAITFSFAFVSLTAGTGALILFGAVQVTMILAALFEGERPGTLEWIGLLLAITGLVYLVLPGLEAPSPLGSALMAVAGISWGLYSLHGRRAIDPLAETTANFIRAVPFALAVSTVALLHLHLTLRGVLVAAISGSVTSGLGYVIWYVALRGLTATRAATVQLSVPVLAALGGVVFLSEMLTLRLISAAVLVLGGIGLAISGRARPHRAG